MELNLELLFFQSIFLVGSLTLSHLNLKMVIFKRPLANVVQVAMFNAFEYFLFFIFQCSTFYGFVSFALQK